MTTARKSTREALALDAGATLLSVSGTEAGTSAASLLAAATGAGAHVVRDEGSGLQLLFSRPLQAVEFALALLEGQAGHDLSIGVLNLGNEGLAAQAVTPRDGVRAHFICGEAPAGSMALCLRSYCAASQLLLDHHWFVAIHGSEINNEVELVVATRVPAGAGTGAYSTFAGLGSSGGGTLSS